MHLKSLHAFLFIFQALRLNLLNNNSKCIYRENIHFNVIAYNKENICTLNMLIMNIGVIEGLPFCSFKKNLEFTWVLIKDVTLHQLQTHKVVWGFFSFC